MRGTLQITSSSESILTALSPFSVNQLSGNMVCLRLRANIVISLEADRALSSSILNTSISTLSCHQLVVDI